MWPKVSLADVADIIDPHPSHRAPNAVTSEGIPFAGIGDFNEQGKINRDSTRLVSLKVFEEHQGRYSLQDDLLALGRVASIGKVIQLPKNTAPYVVSPTLAVIKPRKVDINYLKFALQDPSFLEQLLNASTGSTRKSVGVKVLRNLLISLPDSTEQKNIVAILNEAFASINEAISNTEAAISAANQIFEIILNIVFRPRQEGWEDKRLADISLQFGRGKSKHRPRNDPALYGGSYPFIQTGDVRNSGSLITEYAQTYSDAGLKQSKLWPKGTICITIAANIAETGILGFDACFPDSVIGMMVDPKRCSASFVEYLLQFTKAKLQAAGKGSAQDNINLGTFENMLFGIPSLNDQYIIAKKLDTFAQSRDALLANYTHKLAYLKELKQSLLNQAFSGRLTTDKHAA